jgi:mannose-1-phosphate guanylyltransferase
MIALIMAGGVGSRFWPLSRKSNPKQFLNILSNQSMLQMTVERLLSKIELPNIYIVTAASQVALTKKHLPQLPEENIIVEPFGMNTAPCIALSAKYLAQRHSPQETMLVLPADHLIAQEADFLASLEVAEKTALEDYLVTFGIKPTYPATGYGYIEAGQSLDAERQFVQQFKEKPDLETAQKFLQAGNFYWNSGMFMWKIETILAAFDDYLPKVAKVLQEIAEVWECSGFQADFSQQYAKMPRIPVDVGIMEQAEKRMVIPVDYGWSDVGSWRALYDVVEKDAEGNVFRGDIENMQSKDNYVFSEKFVALLGVDNLIIVDSKDALLIADKSKSEDVKKIVDKLKLQDRDELL